MIFLGQAANYRAGRILRHLLAAGTRRDTEQLKLDLAQAYGAGVKNVALYHSGRSALAAAIRAVAEPGSKVITPGLTCIAVVRAIKAAECEPVFCDLAEGNLEYDLANLEKLAQAQAGSGVILIQNTLGVMWDATAIEDIAQKYHLAIVEDLAHSAGRHYADGRLAGTVGAAVALSFGKGKAIDTINGGAVVILEPKEGFRLAQPTRKPALAERLRDRWYPVFGGLTRTFWRIGLGPKMLTAFVRMHWIEKSADTKLDETVRLTHWQAKLARRQFQKLPAAGALREYRFVRDREKLLAEWREHGAKLDEIWYTEPVSPERYLAEANFPFAKCPRTVWAAQHIVNIPTWYRPKALKATWEILEKYVEEPIRTEDAVKTEDVAKTADVAKMENVAKAADVTTMENAAKAESVIKAEEKNG